MASLTKAQKKAEQVCTDKLMELHRAGKCDNEGRSIKVRGIDGRPAYKPRPRFGLGGSKIKFRKVYPRYGPSYITKC